VLLPLHTGFKSSIRFADAAFFMVLNAGAVMHLVFLVFHLTNWLAQNWVIKLPIFSPAKTKIYLKNAFFNKVS
jgi:hypothetical protein